LRTPKAISDQQQESLRNLLVKTKTKANFQRVQCLWLRAARLPTVRAAPSTVRSKPPHAFRSLRIIMCTSITTNTGPRVLSAFLTYTGRTSRFSSYNPEMPSPPLSNPCTGHVTRCLPASSALRSVFITYQHL
jgi:hypothetical protein